MEKRGVATLVEAILGILLILIVLFAMGAPVVEYAKDKFFKEGKFQPPWRKGEFTPYVTQLSPEESTVDASMNALVFAIESTAGGKATDGIKPFGASLALLEEREKKAKEEVAEKKEEADKEASKKIPTAAVVASKDESILEKIELTKEELEKSITVECGGSFKLVLENKEQGIKDLGQTILDCFKIYKRTNKDVRCRDIVADNLKGSISEKDILNWLDKQKDKDATDLSGDSSLLYQQTWANFKDVKWHISGSITKDLGGGYCIAYNGDGKLFSNWRDNIYVGQCSEKYPKQPFHCDLKNFELPQKIDDEGLAQWDEHINYYGDPRYIVYYEQFPDEEGASWQHNAYDLSYKWMIFSGVMNAGPFKLLKGIKALPRASLRVGKKAFSATFKALEGVTEKMGKETGEEGVKKLSKEAVEEAFTWRRYLRFFRNPSKWFETGLSADDIVRKSLLEELFGEDVATKLFKNIEIDNILTTYSKKATKDELREKVLQKLVKGSKAYDDLVEDLARKSGIKEKIAKEQIELWKLYAEKNIDEFNWLLAERRVLRSEFPFQFEQGIIKSYTDIPDGKIAQEFYEKIQKEAFGISEGSSKEAIEKIAKEGVLDREIRTMGNELGDEIYRMGRLSAEELENLQNFRSLLKNTIDKNGNLDSKAVELMIEDTVTKFPTSGGLRKKATDFLSKKNNLYTNMLTDEGYIKLDYLVDDGLDIAKRLQLENAFFEATKKAPWGGLKEEMGRGIWINLFGDSNGWKEFVSHQNPLSFKGGIVGGTAAKMAIWPFRHRYFTLAMLYYYSSYLDSMDEKNYPHGVNTIQLTQPNLLGLEKPYDLGEELTDYYINMKKDSNEFNRFFLASPCKIDLKLVKEHCLCEVESGSSVLQVSGGLQKVIEGTVVSDEPKYWYAWDYDEELSDEKRLDTMVICSQNGLGGCIDDIKSNSESFKAYVKYLYDNILPKARKGIEAYMDKKGIGKDKEIRPYSIYLEEEAARHSSHGKLMSEEEFEALGIFYQAKSFTTGIIELDAKGKPSDKALFLEEMPSFEEYLKILERFYNVQEMTASIVRMFFLYNEDIQRKKLLSGDVYDITFNEDVKYGDFFGRGKFFWDVTKEHYFHYAIHEKDKSIYGNAVKECPGIELESSQEVYRKIKSLRYDSAELIVPCINVDTTMARHKEYNNKYNYCYTGSNIVLSAARIGIFVSFFVVDAYMTAQTGGVWVFATAATGVAYEYVDQRVVGLMTKWPKHGDI